MEITTIERTVGELEAELKNTDDEVKTLEAQLLEQEQTLKMANVCF